jgi:hypothetical protein
VKTSLYLNVASVRNVTATVKIACKHLSVRIEFADVFESNASKHV